MSIHRGIDALYQEERARADQLFQKNKELKRSLQQRDKELNTARARCKKLSQLLEASEAAKGSLEEHNRKLEAKLLTTDVGAALLKAARAGLELDAARQQINTLKADKEAQVAELKQLQEQLHIVKPLLKATAKQLGLPEGSALLELQRLQEDNRQLQEQTQQLLDEQIRLQEGELQWVRAQQQLREAQQQVEELRQQQRAYEQQLQEAEGDKAALIDYIQELQDGNAQQPSSKARAQTATATTTNIAGLEEDMQQLQELLGVVDGLVSMHVQQQQQQSKPSADWKQQKQHKQQHAQIEEATCTAASLCIEDSWLSSPAAQQVLEAASSNSKRC